MWMKAKYSILIYSVLFLLALGELSFQLSSGLIYLAWNQKYAIILGSILLILCLGMLIHSIQIYQKEKKQITRDDKPPNES
jgi:hypothetical protein